MQPFFEQTLKLCLDQSEVLLAICLLRMMLSTDRCRPPNPYYCEDVFPVISLIDLALSLDVEGKYAAAINTYTRLEKMPEWIHLTDLKFASSKLPLILVCLRIFRARKSDLERKMEAQSLTASSSAHFPRLAMEVGRTDSVVSDASAVDTWSELDHCGLWANDTLPHVGAMRQHKVLLKTLSLYAVPEEEETTALPLGDTSEIALIPSSLELASHRNVESWEHTADLVSETGSAMSVSTTHSRLAPSLPLSHRSFQSMAIRIRKARNGPSSLSSGYMSIDTHSSWSLRRGAGYPHSTTASLRSSE